ncbi:MAG: VOC family protein [Anaerovoracaceae bacterium]|jgi:lactoylglutathione lyase
MKILWTTFQVRDLDETLAFYKKVLEVEPARRFTAGPGREIAFLDGDGAMLELVCEEGRELRDYENVSLGYPVEDVEVKKTELEAAGIPTSPIISPNDNLRFIFATDPNGVGVQFAEEKGGQK